MKSSESENEKLKAFQLQYDRHVAEHGVLFESKEVPMDKADRKKVNSFYAAAYGFCSFFGLLFFVQLYFNYPTTIKDFIYAAVLATLVIGGLFWSYHSRKRVLGKNVKTVVRGVITRKKMTTGRKSDRYSIELSEQEDFDITYSDYKKFSYGDIVQLEFLGNPKLRITGAKMIALGKLPFISQPVLPHLQSDTNSLWSRAGRYVGALLRK